jgi:hypothetical protein
MLWDAGIPFVAAGMPDEYYQCCLELSGERMRVICDRVDFARLSNEQWKRLREGLWTNTMAAVWSFTVLPSEFVSVNTCTCTSEFASVNTNHTIIVFE